MKCSILFSGTTNLPQLPSFTKKKKLAIPAIFPDEF